MLRCLFFLCLQQKLLTRGGRIIALVPAIKASSECSESSDAEDELAHASYYSSSPAPSIDSELERCVQLDDSDNDESQDICLTPIIHEVYPSPSQEPNCSNVPILSDLPSLPSVIPESPACTSTPTTPLTSIRTRTTRSKRPRINPTMPAKRARKIKKFTLNFEWQKTAFCHTATIEDSTNTRDIHAVKSALEYFFLFFSPDIITDILLQTNTYSVSNTGKSIAVTEDELRDFLAIQIIMGIVQMPAYTDYWSTRFRFSLVADLMTLKRYQQIRRNIHFADNNMEDSDRYYKVRPVVQKVRDNCLAQENEQRFSIDEMIIPYKGTKAGKRRQYMKDKPNKWGFKNYVRAGVSGMIYDFILYGGEDTFRFHTFTEEECTLGFGAQIVLALCKSIKNKPSIIYCDNFFSSPELFYILRENYGVFGLGTVRSNRLRGADAILPSDKVLKKKPRGSYGEVACNKNRLSVVRWNDNKPVTLISSYVGTQPVHKIKRYCKESRSREDVDCPQIVKEYNKHMGGVDLADMLISLYKTPFKTRRWYIGIFAQLIDICINNAWLLYRKDHNKISSKKPVSLKIFRFEIYEGLRKTGRFETATNNGEGKKKRQPTQSAPILGVRYDNIGHFMDVTTQGRCRLCSKLTSVICIKCQVRLCFVTGNNSRNCQLDYHTKK